MATSPELTDDQVFGPVVAPGPVAQRPADAVTPNGAVEVWSGPTEAAALGAPAVGAPVAPPQLQAPVPQVAGQPAQPATGELSDADVFGTPKPVSEGLGFMKGVYQPLQKLNDAVNSIPILGSLIGQPPAARANAQAVGGYLANREQTQTPGKIGQFAGNVVGTLPTLALPGGPLVQGAASGAMLSNATDAGGVARDALFGAGGSWLGGKAVGGLLGSIASPAVRPEAQLLLDQGVRLTPGQIMGGTAKRVEDSLTSTPVLGDAIRTAQRRSLSDFNRAGMNDSLSHIGETVPASIDPGRAGIGYVQGKLGDAYDAIAPKLKADIDQPFVQNVGALRQSIAPQALDNLPAFDQIIKGEILSRMGPNGALDGQAAKDAQTAIGQAIRKYSPSSDPKTQALVSGLNGLQDELSASLVRNSPPEAAAKLADINAGYAKFVRLQTAAAGASEKEGGMFTPFQLSKAVKAGDSSVRKGGFARGDALMQGLSSAGEQVLPSSVPDSGTGLRMLMHEIPMMIGFGAESQHFLPQLAGTMALGGAAGFPYSATGQWLARKALTSRPWTPAQSAAALAPVRGLLGVSGAAASQPVAGLLGGPPPQ